MVRVLCILLNPFRAKMSQTLYIDAPVWIWEIYRVLGANMYNIYKRDSLTI